jgi:hypothetical protein
MNVAALKSTGGAGGPYPPASIRGAGFTPAPREAFTPPNAHVEGEA